VRSEDERQRSLEIVDQEARRLSHLVENILQFSRAERHAIKLAPTDTPLAPQISAALEAFDPIARARQVRVVTSLDEGLRGIVDAGALRQILLNLLDNAVKYGPLGQEVRVLLEPSVTRRHARIIVEDQGPGIPPERRDKVWEPFYRLDRDAQSAVAGSGIGLSVVRELARRHGGDATIEDSARGARFVVVLPLCGAAA
jgi:signal transduction histidine kinase